MTAFEELYRNYFGDVYRYIRRLSGDEHIAEEITSETFFKAMHAMDGFRGDCDVRVWLCQIAKNCYNTYLKKQSRTESLDTEPWQSVSDGGDSPSEQVADRDEAMRIQRILHEIPEPYKEVFMWRVYAEMSFGQIARVFGKTENWACVVYHRARKMIKERLEERR